MPQKRSLFGQAVGLSAVIDLFVILGVYGLGLHNPGMAAAGFGFAAFELPFAIGAAVQAAFYEGQKAKGDA